MDLVPYIYCEKQEPGSMLCAQHALNNLLQSPLWSPDNLAEIASKLDSMECSHLGEDQNQVNSTIDKSPNYDDSGFFSVQVIDEALHPLGLRIASWKSEEMKPMHDYPENQEAFILNHDLHWFTLRRFGQSVDRWYNLNSMSEDSPKWIGPTFLSMSIAQAEAEGYSIFAVIPLPPSSDPSAPQPGRLITCEADEQALLLDQLSYSSSSAGISCGSGSSLRRPREEEVRDEPSSSRTRIKLENENQIHDLNYEDQLRMAIEASLTQTPFVETNGNSTENNQQNEQGESRSVNGIRNRQLHDPHVDNHHNHPEFQSDAQVNRLPESSSTDVLGSKTVIFNQFLGVDDDFESLEDKELSMAIAESLLDQTNNLSTPSVPTSDHFVDEPTPDELRQKRLARFSSQN